MNSVTIVDLIRGRPYPKDPFFLDIRLYDTENTVIAALKNLPDQCAKVSISVDVGFHTRQEAISLLRQKNIEIVFV